MRTTRIAFWKVPLAQMPPHYFTKPIHPLPYGCSQKEDCSNSSTNQRQSSSQHMPQINRRTTSFTPLVSKSPLNEPPRIYHPLASRSLHLHSNAATFRLFSPAYLSRTSCAFGFGEELLRSGMLALGETCRMAFCLAGKGIKGLGRYRNSKGSRCK